MKKDKLTLGSLEKKVMECLWDSEKMTCREVHDCLHAKNKKSTAYTTLMTVMDRLYEKGFLSRKKQGKTYVYTSKKDKRQTLQLFAQNMINSLVNTFGEEAIAAFSEELDEHTTPKK